MQSPGVVVLADVYYPGWRLRIDRKETPVLRINRVMRGALVGRGKHRLVFTYEPSSVRIGLAISRASLLAWAGSCSAAGAAGDEAGPPPARRPGRARPAGRPYEEDRGRRARGRGAEGDRMADARHGMGEPSPTERATPAEVPPADPDVAPTLVHPASSGATAVGGSTPTAAGDGLPTTEWRTSSGKSGGPDISAGAFGEYELIAEIARGGMGIVYKARQVGLNRLVALKMVVSGHLAGSDDIQRLLAEAEAAAGLDHPNIVPIHEVGQIDGQHFFSMKLIDGGSLSRQVARLVEDPREAARLMAAVARAVHYAHQRGILHRDLKPANILLDARGEPQVTDFGLALRIEADDGTAAEGAVMGTAAYMPPEQALGRKAEITTASDVYALGATLYELLSGRPPFRGKSAIETIRQVREQEPEPIHNVKPRVDRDLEAIALKALRKDPAERYGSADALADDLDRWLRGEPILARPSSAGARLRKWARRKPAVAALWALVAATALAGVAGILLMWRRADYQRGQAVLAGNRAREEAARADFQRGQALQARNQARAEADRAEANFMRARQAVKDYLLHVSHSAALRRPGLQPLRRDLLTEAMKYYRDFLSQHGDDPMLVAEVAEARFDAGFLLMELGKPAESERETRGSIALYERLLRSAAGSPEAINYQLAQAANNVGNVLRVQGRTKDALAEFRKADAIVSGLARTHTDNPDLARLLATHRANIAHCLYDTGQFAESFAVYESERQRLEAALKRWPDDLVLASRLADSYHSLGNHQADQHEMDQAAASYRRSLELREQVAKGQPDDPEEQSHLARLLNELGMFEDHRANDDDAIRYLGRSLELRERLHRESPEMSDYAEYLARTLDNLGMFYIHRSRPAEAVPYLRRCCELRERLAKAQPANLEMQSSVGGGLHNLAMALDGLGKAAEAEETFRRAIELQLRAFRGEPRVVRNRRFLGNHYFSLALCRLHAGHPEDVAGLCGELRELWPKHPGEQYRAGCLLSIASQALRERDASAADAAAGQAVEALKSAFAAGLTDVRSYEQNPELVPLRKRDDFRKLLAKARARAAVTDDPKLGVDSPR